MAQQTIADGLTADDRGVSPVVGVVLLVAITVLLAATVGTMVMGFADDIGGPEGEPDANMSIAVDGLNESVTVTHEGGDDLEAERLRIDGDVEGAPVTWDEYGTVSTHDSKTLNTTAENPDVYVVYRTDTDGDVLLARNSN